MPVASPEREEHNECVTQEKRQNMNGRRTRKSPPTTDLVNLRLAKNEQFKAGLLNQVSEIERLQRELKVLQIRKRSCLQSIDHVRVAIRPIPSAFKACPPTVRLVEDDSPYLFGQEVDTATEPLRKLELDPLVARAVEHRYLLRAL